MQNDGTVKHVATRSNRRQLKLGPGQIQGATLGSSTECKMTQRRSSWCAIDVDDLRRNVSTHLPSP